MIDLDSIQIPDLPEKTVQVRFRGKLENFVIRPMTGEKRIRFISLDVPDEEQDTRTIKRMKLALTCVKGINEGNAGKMTEIDWQAVGQLTNRVIEFTHEYERSLLETAKQAEKNSLPDGVEQTHTA